MAEDIENLTVGFHKAAEILCSTLFTDPYFDLKFSGYGFDRYPVRIGPLYDVLEPGSTTPRYFSQSVSQICNFGFVANYGAKVYHVLKDAVALPSGHYLPAGDSPHKFIFNLQTVKDSCDKLQVYVTSNTSRALQEQFKYHFSLSKAIVCEEDESSQSLNSCKARRTLSKYVGNLAVIRPDVLFTLLKGDGCDDVEVRGQNFSHLGRALQVLKAVFTLDSPVWPGVANDFIMRIRKSGWPNADLIQHVAGSGVYVIPVNDSTGHWQYCFHSAEKSLLDSLNENTQLFFKSILGLIQSFTEITQIRCDVAYTIFLHSFFWFLESSKDIHEQLLTHNDDKQYLYKFLHFLAELYKENKCIPHYFIGGLDVKFECCENSMITFQEVIDNITEKYKSFVDYLCRDIPLVPEECSQSARKCVQSDISCVVANNLLSAYHGTIDMAHMLMYAKLNTLKDIDSCIEYHQLMLQTLQESESILTPWACKLVKNSLADLYLAKCGNLISNTSESTQSKVLEDPVYQENASIAESILKECLDVDLCSSTVKLLNLYFITEKDEEVVKLYVESQVSTKHCVTNVWQKSANIWSSNNEICDEFLDIICSRNIALYLLYSRSNCLPNFLVRNLRLTTTCVLGMTQAPVYVFNADVIAQLLYTLSLHNTKQASSTLEHLRKLEVIAADRKQNDFNDKRNFAYINAIALCYKDIELNEECERLLAESREKLTGPGNPAFQIQMGIGIKRLKNKALYCLAKIGGMAVFIAVIAVLGTNGLRHKSGS